MLKPLLGLLCLIVLSSCAMVAEQYKYAPRQLGEVPALMQFEDKPSQNLEIHIRRVNNLYLFNFRGTVSEEIKNNKIRLSPGTNNLVLWGIDGGADVATSTTLNVEPGEDYTLRIAPGLVWITNKTGASVFEYRYTKRMVIR